MARTRVRWGRWQPNIGDSELLAVEKRRGKKGRPPAPRSDMTGVQLREWRKIRKLSQSALAGHLAIYQPQLSAWESGRTPIPASVPARLAVVHDRLLLSGFLRDPDSGLNPLAAVAESPVPDTFEQFSASDKRAAAYRRNMEEKERLYRKGLEDFPFLAAAERKKDKNTP